MHIALFGGSFNPPHLAHVLCALYAYKIANVQAVWVMPAIEHPYGKQLLDWDARWELCEAAFAGLDFIELRDDELRNAGGKTYNLLCQLQEQYPANTWSLVGGTDTVNDLPNWYQGEALSKIVDVIAVPRQGFDDNSDVALPAISSSLVRSLLASDQSADALLPCAVAELIRKNNYYQSK